MVLLLVAHINLWLDLYIMMHFRDFLMRTVNPFYSRLNILYAKRSDSKFIKPYKLFIYMCIFLQNISQ